MFSPIIIEIPQYVRNIQLSKAQRPKYYFVDENLNLKTKGKKVPKKFFHNVLEYPKVSALKPEYKIHLFLGNKMVKKPLTPFEVKKVKALLCDKDDNLIIANATRVGQPKIQIISGQDIYSGNMYEHTRVKIMDLIKVQMFKALENIKPIEHYPIRIEMEVHDTVKNAYDRSKDMDGAGGRWDIGNRSYPYGKAFGDVLSELNIIKDDDRLHVTQEPLGAVFCPLPDNDDSKRFLRFIIKYDDREIIKNNKFYGGKDIKP